MGSGKKKAVSKKPPTVTKTLQGLDITINSFGEIQSSYDIDKINAFLDEKVKDPKISDARRTDAADND